MKKILFLVLGGMFALASCTHEAETPIGGIEEYADVTIVADLSDPALTRALNPGSKNSGLDNVDESVYSLRYQLEVLYDGEVVRTAKNIEAITAKPVSTVFTISLARGKEYQLVIWADFVKSDGQDLHYDTSDGLSAIRMKTGNYKVSDESKDAYFASQAYEVGTTAGPGSVSIVLKRPLAKIRYIATDYNESESKDATGFYAYYSNGTVINTTFDAATGGVSGPALATGSSNKFEFDLIEEISNKDRLIFWDYVFVANDTAPEVGFTIGYTYPGASTGMEKDFIDSRIVAERNKLTTVRGGLFTSSQTVEVTIDDSFDDENYATMSSVSIRETGYATIAEAMAAAQPGDVISLMEGEFNEDVNLKAGVTLEGAGSATVVKGYIQVAAGSTLKNFKSYYLGKSLISGSSTRTALYISGTGVTVDGVIFETGDGRAFSNGSNVEAIVTSGNVSGLKFINNTISNPYWKGIYINDSEGVEITGNTFNNMNPFSIDNVGQMTVTGNTFQRNSLVVNSQCTHLVVPGVTAEYKAGSSTNIDWDATLTGELRELVISIKNDNTWTGRNVTIKPVRITGSDFDLIARGSDADLTTWGQQNP